MFAEYKIRYLAGAVVEMEFLTAAGFSWVVRLPTPLAAQLAADLSVLVMEQEAYSGA
jgi:hypothetical protein